jgi:hypothetical protein
MPSQKINDAMDWKTFAAPFGVAAVLSPRLLVILENMKPTEVCAAPKQECLQRHL